MFQIEIKNCFIFFSLADYEDEIAHWWAAAVGVATYWLLDEDEQAKVLYSRVEKIPRFLENNQDSLPRALLSVYRFRIRSSKSL